MRKLSLLARTLFQLAVIWMPWWLRRRVLRTIGFELHETSRIGLSLILADKVILDEGARIDNFTLVSPVAYIHLHRFALIGRGNRIVGRQRTRFYVSEADRVSALVMEEHAHVTRNHVLDCTNHLTIGRFALIAGWNSQILTHSPDFDLARQASAPLRIGAYSFLGTRCIVLKGANIADYSVLAAGSVMHRASTEPYILWSGVPATAVRRLNPDAEFFSRKVGAIS